MKQRFPFQSAASIRLLILDVDGVLTSGGIHIGSQGEEFKTFHVRDGHGIKLLQRAGVRVAILTGRNSPVVAYRAAELGIEHIVQGSLNKSQGLDRLLQATGLCADDCAYMGDDIVDLPAMRRCALSFAPADAHIAVQQQADAVSAYMGGQGAVRELCEALVLAVGAWPSVMAEPYGLSPESCAWPSLE